MRRRHLIRRVTAKLAQRSQLGRAYEGALALALGVLAAAATTVRLLWGAPVFEAVDLNVEVAGCDMIATAGGEIACELWGASIFEAARRQNPDRNVTLWVRTSPGATTTIGVDGRAARVLNREEAHGGQRFEVLVEKGARALTVTAKRGVRSVEHRLSIVTAEASPDLLRLREAMAQRRHAEHRKSAAAALDDLRRSPSASVRAKATAQLARVAASEDVDRAIALLREAQAIERAAGRVADEVGDALFLATLLRNDKHDLAASDAAIAKVAPLLDRFPEGRAIAPHYRAITDLERGDLGAAYERATESEQRAERLDLQGHLADVYQRKLEILSELGRAATARRYFEEKVARPPSERPCAVAQYENNRGWYKILAGVAESQNARLDLESARKLFSKDCANPRELYNVLENLAWLALDLGRPEEAAGFLREARATLSTPPPHLAATWEMLSARVALGRRDPSAVPLFRGARRLAEAAGLSPHEIAASLGLAEALEASGRIDEALRAYDEADARLNTWSALVPFGEGKQAFFAQHARGVRRDVDLLVSQGMVRQAACVSRRSLSRAMAMGAWAQRVVSAPDKHAIWQEAWARYERARRAQAEELAQAARLADAPEREARLARLVESMSRAATELDRTATTLAGAPPAPPCHDGASPGLTGPAADEVLLVYHPSGEGESWAALAITREREAATTFDLTADELREPESRSRSEREAAREGLANKLLAPFADILDASKKRIRILAPEQLGAVDFASIPWEGATLDARFLISHGVDITSADAALRTHEIPPATPRALVLAPGSDLSDAAGEAEHVAGALRGAGFEVRVLLGAAARRAAVREELSRPGVEVFHYVGHGIAGGLDGWDSHLRLDDGEWLSIADVMSLERAPRITVLASCEAAATKSESFVLGPSLAGAFLAAGSTAVIASPTPVSDAATTELMISLYDRLPSLRADPAAALRDARKALPGSPALRAYVR